ncbi:unnamed protein product [Anisakis simplex]|uniref:C2H2-type domain-containing protein n=1 Tax=Anisakis simplex TaxID=6269 RepID=A0A0M3K4W4_ANISI|nr:unnamed protein product [Anisakis simplex]
MSELFLNSACFIRKIPARGSVKQSRKKQAKPPIDCAQGSSDIAAAALSPSNILNPKDRKRKIDDGCDVDRLESNDEETAVCSSRMNEASAMWNEDAKGVGNDLISILNDQMSGTKMTADSHQSADGAIGNDAGNDNMTMKNERNSVENGDLLSKNLKFRVPQVKNAAKNQRMAQSVSHARRIFSEELQRCSGDICKDVWQCSDSNSPVTELQTTNFNQNDEDESPHRSDANDIITEDSSNDKNISRTIETCDVVSNRTSITDRLFDDGNGTLQIDAQNAQKLMSCCAEACDEENVCSMKCHPSTSNSAIDNQLPVNLLLTPSPTADNAKNRSSLNSDRSMKARKGKRRNQPRLNAWSYFDICAQPSSVSVESTKGAASADLVRVVRCRVEDCNREFSFPHGNKNYTKEMLMHALSHERPRKQTNLILNIARSRHQSSVDDDSQNDDASSNSLTGNDSEQTLRNDVSCASTAMNASDNNDNLNATGEFEQSVDSAFEIFNRSNEQWAADNGIKKSNWIKSSGKKYEWLIPIKPPFRQRGAYWNHFILCMPKGGIATGQLRPRFVARCRIGECVKEFDCSYRYTDSMLRHVQIHRRKNQMMLEEKNQQKQDKAARNRSKVLVARNRNDMLIPLLITAATDRLSSTSSSSCAGLSLSQLLSKEDDNELRCYAWVRCDWNEEKQSEERYGCVGCSHIYPSRDERYELFNIPKLVISSSGTGKITIPDQCEHFCEPERCSDYCDFRYYDPLSADPFINPAQLKLNSEITERLKSEVNAMRRTVLEVAVDDDLRFVKVIRLKWDDVLGNDLMDSGEDRWQIILDTYLENGWEWRSKQLPKERWESIVNGVEAKRKSFVSTKNLTKCERIVELMLRRIKDNECWMSNHEGTSTQMSDTVQEEVLDCSHLSLRFRSNRRKDTDFMRAVSSEWPVISMANICDDKGRKQLRAAWDRIGDVRTVRKSSITAQRCAPLHWSYLCPKLIDNIRRKSSSGKSWVPDEAESLLMCMLDRAPKAIRLRKRGMKMNDLRIILTHLLENHPDFVTTKWRKKELESIFDEIADTYALNERTREQLLHAQLGYLLIMLYIRRTLMRWNRYRGASFLVLFNECDRLALKLCEVDISAHLNDIQLCGNRRRNKMIAIAKDEIRFVKLVSQLRDSMLLCVPLNEPWQIIYDTYQANRWQWMWPRNALSRWRRIVSNFKMKRKARDKKGENWVMSKVDTILANSMSDVLEFDGKKSRNISSHKFEESLRAVFKSIAISSPNFDLCDDEDRQKTIRQALSYLDFDADFLGYIVQNSARLLSTILATAKKGLVTKRVLSALECSVLKLFKIDFADAVDSTVANSDELSVDELVSAIQIDAKLGVWIDYSSINQAKRQISHNGPHSFLLNSKDTEVNSENDDIMSAVDDDDVYGFEDVFSDNDEDDNSSCCDNSSSEMDCESLGGWVSLIPKEEPSGVKESTGVQKLQPCIKKEMSE